MRNGRSRREEKCAGCVRGSVRGKDGTMIKRRKRLGGERGSGRDSERGWGEG